MTAAATAVADADGWCLGSNRPPTTTTPAPDAGDPRPKGSDEPRPSGRCRTCGRLVRTTFSGNVRRHHPAPST